MYWLLSSTMINSRPVLLYLYLYPTADDLETNAQKHNFTYKYFICIESYKVLFLNTMYGYTLFLTVEIVTSKTVCF
jgi:hypothetical protein